MSTDRFLEKSRVIQLLMRPSFQGVDNRPVRGADDLIPLVCAAHPSIDDDAVVDPAKVPAIRHFASIVDKARKAYRRTRCSSGSTLEQKLMAAQRRKAAFTGIARMLTLGLAFLDSARVNARLSSREGTNEEGYPILYSATLRLYPRHSQPRTRKSNKAAGVIDIPDPISLIAAGYLARQEVSAEDLPDFLDRLTSALKSVGSLPETIDEAQSFADELAEALEEPALVLEGSND